jgi:hypothetical protein
VRAEPGRANGDCGGIAALVLTGSGLWTTLSCEQDEQLLERDELDWGEAGLDVSVFTFTADAVLVLAHEFEDAVVVTDSEDAVDGKEGLSGKLKRVVPVADCGLRAGESFERKSRYAAGGVMGVFWLSSCLMKLGVATSGLRSSEGYEADKGVFRADNWGRVAAMAEEKGGTLQWLTLQRSTVNVSYGKSEYGRARR